MAERFLVEAVNDALHVEMERDADVLVLGEDVADSAGGGVFHVTDGLSAKHGEHRVRNTPISEEAITIVLVTMAPISSSL